MGPGMARVGDWAAAAIVLLETVELEDGDAVTRCCTSALGSELDGCALPV